MNGEIPSLSLQYRLEAALDYAKQFPHVYLILSGGQGAGEHISESEAMKRFLVENGIERNGYWLKTCLLLHMKIYFIQPRMIPDSEDRSNNYYKRLSSSKSKKYCSKSRFSNRCSCSKNTESCGTEIENT